MHSTLNGLSRAFLCSNLLILFIGFIFFPAFLLGQNPIEINGKLLFERTSKFPPGYPVPDSTELTEFGIIVINIADTFEVEDFAIRIGNTTGGSEVFDGILSANGTVPLGTNQAVNHVPGTYVIRIGSFSLAQTTGIPLSINVVIETMDGSYVPELSFSYSNP